MSAQIIDFQAVRNQRDLPTARPQRSREELLRLGRNEWIKQQLLKQIDEWGWDKDVPIVG